MSCRGAGRLGRSHRILKKVGLEERKTADAPAYDASGQLAPVPICVRRPHGEGDAVAQRREAPVRLHENLPPEPGQLPGPALQAVRPPGLNRAFLKWHSLLRSTCKYMDNSYGGSRTAGAVQN